MFMTVPHPRKYGLKLLLCTFMAFPYTTYELEINLSGPIQNDYKDRANR